jgi:cyclopropane fatty-acyl-phospholipid synthase-like methyltransferase
MAIAKSPGNQKEWWEDGGGFFGHGYMEGDNSNEGFLSNPMTLAERTRQEVDGVVKLLELQADQRILDCPCGYGRHSLELAKRGFQVVGVDINREELTRARRAGDNLTNTRFQKEDMRLLKFSEEFDAVINMFYSFGFFKTDEENFQVLRNFFSALKPGGKLLMHTDVNLSRVLEGEYKFAEKRHLHSGRVLQIVDTYDPESKRINGKWTLIDENGMVEELAPYSVRVFSLEEFAIWCYEAGFKEVNGYGSWQKTKPTSSSEEMMVVAEK